ncbi:hypothetical protein BDN67DRAFT_170727 [Paxillus ammoniavirescens]|nr:hypothetical protein BDN67DRAFT_170727 [Paxillus ammoniavirescens]
MRTFLTLLVTIISLSAYTLAGVPTQCAMCPHKLLDLGQSILVRECTGEGTTTCMYKQTAKPQTPNFFCHYDVVKAARQKFSDAPCPSSVERKWR